MKCNIDAGIVIKGAMVLVWYMHSEFSKRFIKSMTLIRGDSPSFGSGSNKFKGSYYLGGVLFEQLFWDNL